MRLTVGVVAAGLASGTGTAQPESAFPPVLELRDLSPVLGGDGSAGFIIKGFDADDWVGHTVGAAGDLNDDGIDDVFIWAHSSNEHPLGYVVFGRGTGFPAAFGLISLYPPAGGDGSSGFIVDGRTSIDSVVGAAGDVNGDGIDDLIVGDPRAQGGGFEDGASYVVFGRTAGFPAGISVLSLYPAPGGDGSQGFVLAGIANRDWSGTSVAGAGDVNGDGIDDMIIGAANASPNGQRYAGESYVVFGRATGFPAAFPLRRLDPDAGGDGSEGFILRGIHPADACGSSVAGVGDVNGDGVDDVIISAPNASPDGREFAGESYVVFGRTSGIPAELDLQTLESAHGGDGSVGFILKGIDRRDAAVDPMARGAGDVNGDGIDDLVIGASNAEPVGRFLTGESYLVFGRNTGFPAEFQLSSLQPDSGGDGSAGFIIVGAADGDLSGGSVGGAGDVNSDGIDDLIIGATGANLGARGDTYVLFGHTAPFTAVLELSSLYPPGGDGSAGFILSGIKAGDESGESVSAGGDVNGDGIADVIVGAPFADRQQIDVGEAYVVFGRAPDAR